MRFLAADENRPLADEAGHGCVSRLQKDALMQLVPALTSWALLAADSRSFDHVTGRTNTMRLSGRLS